MHTHLRFLLLSLSLMVFSTVAFSQVRVSPKVGVNLSGVDAKIQDINAEARAGWNAGLDFRIGDGFIYLAPGLHYYSVSARLVQDIESPDDVNFSDETTIQSLRAPLNIGLRITGDNGLLGIYARGGVTPSYVLGVNEKPSFAFSADDLNRFTWGANVGLGIDLLFLTADLNYEMGLNDFFKDAAGRNNLLTLSVGFKF